ncbi:MAG: hypothetical protein RJA25_469 [Bacteroidota bacterium]|jgi:hypothetical protein
MQKSLTYSYIGLITLTIIGVCLATFSSSKYITNIIILFSIIKFLMVGFQFMELKEAHAFWKILLIAYCILIGIVLFILI